MPDKDIRASLESLEPAYRSGGADESIHYAEFKKPPKFLDESDDMLQNAVERFKRRRVDLDDEETELLKTEIDRIIFDWEDSRSTLETKLVDLNDLFEGVTEEADFPWVGASSLHVPMPKIKAREIVSVINRTSMRPIPFAVTKYAGPDSLYDESKDFVKDLESFVEDKLKNDTNIHETLKSALPVIFRDGTAFIQVAWETEYERVCDYKLYEKAEDFVADYPDPGSTGVAGSKWQTVFENLTKSHKCEIRYEYDVPTYDAPKSYLVPLMDSFYWPVFVGGLKDTLCHGKRVWYTDYQLRMKANMGLFDEEDVEDILKSGGDERRDSLAVSRDRIEGVNRNTGLQESKEHEIFEIVYKAPVTKEDRRENVYRKYVVYYYRKTNKILRVEHYPVRKGALSYFTLRFLKRDGRLLGISLLDDIMDLCDEVDIQHRQRVNSRTITHVPSFKARMTAKPYFDPNRKELRFRPGTTFYLANLDDVTQFDIRPVDLSGSTEDELLLFQLIDMTVGSTSGFSGQSNPIDPRAPARKQQELLRQSGNRIDDYVQNLLPDFSSICQFMVDLYYQYAPERIKYYARTEDGRFVEKEMERAKLFNPQVKFKINGTSVFMNADLEYDRALEIDALIRQNPITMQNPKILKRSLERVLMSSRIEDEKAFLPDDSEMPEAVTNTMERELEEKSALQREKMMARMEGDASKRQHEKEMALIGSVANAVNAPGANGGAPVAP